MEYAVISDKGEREKNEDSVIAVNHEENYMFVLADGLGGHGYGEIASTIVASSAKAIFDDDTADFKSQDHLIRLVLEKAQCALLEKQEDDRNKSSYKTTAVLLAVNETAVQWGYIGDSRLYYFRRNKMVRRTLDHSVPQMLVNAGKIKEAQIREHEDRNKLLRVLGTKYDSVKYVVEESVRRGKGQAFLLCSDGFWEWIDEKSMLKFLKKSHSAQEWLDQMKEKVVRNGTGNHMDNYSAIAVML